MTTPEISDAANTGGCAYRAQVRSNDDSVWVDSGLYRKRKNAEADAERLAAQYGNEVRVIEEEHHVAHRG